MGAIFIAERELKLFFFQLTLWEDFPFKIILFENLIINLKMIIENGIQISIMVTCRRKQNHLPPQKRENLITLGYLQNNDQWTINPWSYWGSCDLKFFVFANTVNKVPFCSTDKCCRPRGCSCCTCTEALTPAD